MVVLLAVGILGYFYYPRNYPVFADVSKPEEFPEVSWQDIVQGRVARLLRRQSPPLPAGVVPVAAYTVSGQGVYEELGIGFVLPANEALASGVYADSTKRPYRFVTGYTTTMEEETYYVLYSQWHNADGSVSYLPYIFADNRVFWQGQVDEKYLQLLDPENNYYLAPVMDFRRIEICTASMGNLDEYCAWMMDEGRVRRYRQLQAEWAAKGVIPREMERYPVMFNRQLWVVGGGV
jgi:hypothetical protein